MLTRIQMSSQLIESAPDIIPKTWEIVGKTPREYEFSTSCCGNNCAHDAKNVTAASPGSTKKIGNLCLTPFTPISYDPAVVTKVSCV